MRNILASLLIISSIAFTAAAQSESHLKEFFEGKRVAFRIDMPATKDGVNVYPERSQSLDYSEYKTRLKKYGLRIHHGEVANIGRIKIKNLHIEVRFTNSREESARFNIHFARAESWMLTPSALIDALSRYVEFSDSDKRMARSQTSTEYAAGYVRKGVIHLGPRNTFLKEGLRQEEVMKLLGEPVSVSKRQEKGQVVSIYEFIRSEGRVLIAEFIDNILVGSRTEARGIAQLSSGAAANN